MVRMEYDGPAFTCVTLRVFEVRDGFPRITPKDIVQGVNEVSYMLALNACIPYEISDPFAETKK